MAIRQRGLERTCEARPQKLDEVPDWIEQYRQSWEQRFDRLGNLLEELQQKGKMDDKN